MVRGWVYIVASRHRGTLYTGVTADIVRRTWQHRERAGAKFAAKHGVTRLVLVEPYDSIEDAIVREKRMEPGLEIRLIEEANPGWLDLWETINC